MDELYINAFSVCLLLFPFQVCLMIDSQTRHFERACTFQRLDYNKHEVATNNR